MSFHRNLNNLRQPRVARGTMASLGTLAAALFAAAPANAQEATAKESDSTISDIVVTATRRSENLQDVGIAVSAFTGDTLKDMNVTQTEDLALATPGLQLQYAGSSPAVALVALRGVSQNDFAPHIEAPIAFYVDEVYQPNNATSAQQFYDVGRIEILRGPQGTLFGRNATGGLIHVLTAQPSRDFNGFVSAAYGEYNQFRVEAGVGGPIGEGVTYRASFFRNRNDGFIKNDIGPDVNSDDTMAGRLQILLEPTETLSIKLSGSIYHIRDATAGGGYPTAGTLNADGVGVRLPPGTPTQYGYVDADGDPFTSSQDYSGNLNRKQQDVSSRISYDAGDISFSSLTSYSKLRSIYDEDHDLSPLNYSTFDQGVDTKNFTQELRVSEQSGDLRWTAGVFYLDINGNYTQGFDFRAISAYPRAIYSQDTKSWSVFAQTEYDLSPTLTLTTGLRYSKDKKSLDYTEICILGCPALQAPGTIGTLGRIVDSHKEGGWSGRFQLDWQPNDDTLLYASINRGYKASNYNAGFIGAAPIPLLRFKGEKLTAYEVGAKLDLLDGHLRVNAATYYYDYKDFQASDQRGINLVIFNTDAKFYGADTDITISPGGGFTFVAGASLLNTKVYNVPFLTGPRATDATQSPGLTLNLTASKDFELGFGRLNFVGAVKYTDKYYSQLTNAPASRIPSNWLVNGRIALTDSSEMFELALNAKNIFNSRRLVYVFDTTGPGFGQVENSYAPPRQVTVEARINF